jgi:hypothetical protein
MNRWLISAPSFAVALLLFAFGTAVHAAPSQLLNKTINVVMGISVPAKGSGGAERIYSRRVYRSIYISSQGRVFQKVIRQAKGGGDDRELGPDTGNGLHFVGNKLVGMVKMISGANMLTISFDPSFQSCTADLVVGFEPGKPRVWKALNGETVSTTTKPSVSGVSCSIREGNAFAS